MPTGSDMMDKSGRILKSDDPELATQPRTALAERVDTVRSLLGGSGLGRSLVRARGIPSASLRQSVLSLATAFPAVARRPFGPLAEAAAEARAGRFGRISFIAVVIVPTLVVGLYCALFASNQYVAEMRFAVRGSVQGLPGVNEFGAASLLMGLNNNQESQFLAVYIRSRAMVEAVESKVDLRGMFNRPRLDFWARLGPDRILEDLERHWQRMVNVSTEAISGILTVEVRAFTAADALAIAKAIQVESERLLNDMSGRVRQDTMAFAEQRLRAEVTDLTKVWSELHQYRDRQRVIDASLAAMRNVDTVAELQRERMKRGTELAAARRSLAADAPSLRQLTDRIAVLDATIHDSQALNSQPSTGVGPGASPDQRLQYDWLTVQLDMNEQRVKSAETALDRARMDLQRHQIFLTTFSPPALPERSLYPLRIKSVATVLMSCLVLWGLGALLGSGAREHAD